MSRRRCVARYPGVDLRTREWERTRTAGGGNNASAQVQRRYGAEPAGSRHGENDARGGETHQRLDRAHGRQARGLLFEELRGHGGPAASRSSPANSREPNSLRQRPRCCGARALKVVCGFWWWSRRCLRAAVPGRAQSFVVRVERARNASGGPPGAIRFSSVQEDEGCLSF